MTWRNESLWSDSRQAPNNLDGMCCFLETVSLMLVSWCEPERGCSRDRSGRAFIHQNDQFRLTFGIWKWLKYPFYLSFEWLIQNWYLWSVFNFSGRKSWLQSACIREYLEELGPTDVDCFVIFYYKAWLRQWQGYIFLLNFELLFFGIMLIVIHLFYNVFLEKHSLVCRVKICDKAQVNSSSLSFFFKSK